MKEVCWNCSNGLRQTQDQGAANEFEYGLGGLEEDYLAHPRPTYPVPLWGRLSVIAAQSSV